MTRRVFSLAALLALAVTQTADAANMPISLAGGAWSLKAPDRLHVWANSPQATLGLDNRRNTSFTTMNVHWQNLVAGAYVSTPEGVVLGSSRDGDPMATALSLPPGERQRWSLAPNINGAYRFAVIAKTKNAEAGQRTYGELAKRMGAQNTQFSLHLGDAVSGGNARQLELFREQLKAFPFPTYALPGSDDLAGDGRKAWARLFGAVPLSFKVDKDRFLMLDNAAGTLRPDQRTWLERSLQAASDERARHIFVFLNKPLVDPRPGINRGMKDVNEVRALLGLFQRHGVRTVFAGHLPLYARETRRGVDYVVTGGGGDKLYGKPQQGGYHHYVQVEVNGDAVNVYPVRGQ